MRSCLLMLLVACGPRAPQTTVRPSNSGASAAAAASKEEQAPTASADPSAQPAGEVGAPATTAGPTLAVTAVEPARGDAQGGTYVLLKGSRFVKDGPRQLKVYFGGKQGTVVRFQSDTEVIIQAPGGTPGAPVDVVVVFDPGGQLTLPGAFTFVDKP